MLADWQRGGRSAPHDHGLARGFVVILEGCFSETTFEFDGSELRATAEVSLGVGDLLRAPAGRIHDMCAEDGGLTLHVYVPGIETMRVYDLRERATLLVSGGCGAWIPRHPELILEKRRWTAALATRPAASA